MARSRASIAALLALAAACSSDASRASRQESAPEPGVADHGPGATPALDRGFRPPDARRRVRAIGNLTMLSDRAARAFRPGAGFRPISEPEPGDWLAEHPESGQSFDDFVAGRFQRPNHQRGVIYLLPIGPLGDAAPRMQVLADYIEAYFQLPVRQLPGVAVSDVHATQRARTTGVQLLAPDILEHLREALPSDAFCLVGVTGVDLYPDDEWNFVFGMATFRDRVGVYSLARYHPSFLGENVGSDGAARLVLERTLKVMAHEIGHMFGLEHCVYYECVLDGSNHLGETDRRPPHACPVCLHKLHHSIGFDPAVRYRQLEKFYRRHRLRDEAEWVAARRTEIAAAP